MLSNTQLHDFVSHKLLEFYIAYQVFIISLAAVLLFCCQWRKSATHIPNHPSVALQSFITPKTSRWPIPYLNLIRKSCRSRNHTMLISLDALVTDILENRVELRDPCKHIQELLLHRHIYTGHWKLKVFTENGMVSDLLTCLIRRKFDDLSISPIPVSVVRDPGIWSSDSLLSPVKQEHLNDFQVKHRTKTPDDSPFFDLLLSESNAFDRSFITVVSLDEFTFRGVRRVQQKIRSALFPSNGIVVLEIPLLNKTLSLMDPCQAVMYVLPTLIRSRTTKVRCQPPANCIKDLPFLLDTLTLGAAPNSLIGLHNISSMHISKLKASIASDEAASQGVNILSSIDNSTHLRQRILCNRWEVALYELFW